MRKRNYIQERTTLGINVESIVVRYTYGYGHEEVKIPNLYKKPDPVKKRNKGGQRVKDRRKNYYLCYADDVGIITKKDKTKRIMEKLKEFFMDIRMRLNERKTYYLSRKWESKNFSYQGV